MEEIIEHVLLMLKVDSIPISSLPSIKKGETEVELPLPLGFIF